MAVLSSKVKFKGSFSTVLLNIAKGMRSPLAGLAYTKTISFGLALFFKGIPVYEGHPDDPAWLRQNPGHKPDAKARIKSFDVGADGLYATTVFNSEGAALISGEAPKYSAHSPRWRMIPIPGRANCMRPVLLWSTGLTNSPNIPDSTIALNSAAPGIPADEESQPAAADGTGEPETNDQDDTMKLTVAALAALGFAPEATPSDDEISTAIVKLAGDKQTTEETATAANSKVIDLQAALATARTAAVDTVINTAIAEGRITEGNKQKWVDALNTDFDGERAKIAKLMPALNTQNRLPGNTSARRGEQAEMATGIDAINSAVTSFAAEKQIDITTAAGWTRAFEGARAAKPEIFARK
jgi:hypothetical protein